jgi:3',5'-nucleoside bisphosphate phosphatase
VTEGSDYHGAVKPGVKLGTGYGGNLRIPDDLLERLRNGPRMDC